MSVGCVAEKGASVPAQVMSVTAKVAPGWSDWEVYGTKKQLRNADVFSQMLGEVIPTALGAVAVSRRAAAEQWW